MSEITRRNLLHAGIAVAAPCGVAALLTGCQQSTNQKPANKSAEQPNNDHAGQANAQSSTQSASEPNNSNQKSAGDIMKIQFLEIVTPQADSLCDQYAQTNGLTFSEPVANLGGARTAKLDGGGMLSIRGPLRPDEKPVVRPYVLVEDIKAAVAAAAKAGAEVAIESMEIPDHGTIAIVIHGGIECGFWQA